MSDTAGSGWVGWGWFAAIMIIIAGVFDALYCLVAIQLPQSSYIVVTEGSLLMLYVYGWGWLHLIVGAHAVHEYVELDSIPERAAIVAGMIDVLTRG